MRPTSPRPVELPIDAHLSQIVQQWKTHSSLLIVASPGSGKTTRVPAALLRSGHLAADQEIWVLEPRRLAAEFSARRVAEEWGQEVGQTVGYRFRFENTTSAQTRLLYLTEGMLTRMLLRDPLLKRVSTVVLDEFHERHLHSDIALALLRKLQLTTRPDLKLVVMSATLDTESLAPYLGTPQAPAPTIKIQAPRFGVDLIYLSEAESRVSLPLETRVKKAVLQLLDQTPGDLLIFLPGMSEIRKSMAAVAPYADTHSLLLLPLHSEISADDQRRAVRARTDSEKHLRKILFSTNIAETSLTLPGVTGVIDSGLHRQAKTSPLTGISHLQTRPVSRASAIQRAGRAGRLAPGVCVRLYTEHDFLHRAPFDLPEIHRTDLSQVFLEVLHMNLGGVVDLPWFDPPTLSAWDGCAQLLYGLGALPEPNRASHLTPLGKILALCPAPPRISRFLVESIRVQSTTHSLPLAAALLEADDLPLNILDLLPSSSESPRVQGGLHPLRHAHPRTQSLLQASIKEMEHLVLALPKSVPPSIVQSTSLSEKIAWCFLTGFFDRIAKKPPSSSQSLPQRIEFHLPSLGRFELENARALEGPYFKKNEPEVTTFALLDLIERTHSKSTSTQPMGSRTPPAPQVKTLCPISENWLLDLEPSPLSERVELQWNRELEKLEGHASIFFGELLLDQSPVSLFSLTPLLQEKRIEILAKEVFGTRIETAPAAIEDTLMDALHRLQAKWGPERSQPWMEWTSRLCLLFNSSHLKKQKSEAIHSKNDLEPPPETETVSFPDFSPRGSASRWLRWVISHLPDLQSLEQIQSIEPQTHFSQCCPELPAHTLETALPRYFHFPNGRRALIHYDLQLQPWIESRLQDFFGLKQNPKILHGQLALTLHLLAPNRRAVQVTQDLASFWKTVYPELRPALSRRYPRHAWPVDPPSASESGSREA